MTQKGEFIANRKLLKEFAYIALSLAAHMLLLLFVWTQNETNVSKDETPFQVDLIEVKSRKTIPKFVMSDLEDKLEDIKKRASALSDKKRRVELESRKARKSVDLRMPMPVPTKKNFPSAKESKQAKENSKPSRKRDLYTTKNGIPIVDGRKPLHLPFAHTRAIPSPRIPQPIVDSLPEGLELGQISALNTDQHLFYNFHSRLIGSFAPKWARLVSQTVYRWLQNDTFPRVPKSWVTNVEVILDEHGDVIDVQHYRLSGLWPFDEAPVKAFKALKKVPNPPKEMVGDDGYIRLKFQTEVHWRPQPLSRMDISSGQKSYQ